MITNNLDCVKGSNNHHDTIAHAMSMANQCYQTGAPWSIGTTLKMMGITGTYRNIMRFPAIIPYLHDLYTSMALWMTDDKYVEEACAELIKMRVPSVSFASNGIHYM